MGGSGAGILFFPPELVVLRPLLEENIVVGIADVTREVVGRVLTTDLTVGGECISAGGTPEMDESIASGEVVEGRVDPDLVVVAEVGTGLVELHGVGPLEVPGIDHAGLIGADVAENRTLYALPPHGELEVFRDRELEVAGCPRSCADQEVLLVLGVQPGGAVSEGHRTLGGVFTLDEVSGVVELGADQVELDSFRSQDRELAVPASLDTRGIDLASALTQRFYRVLAGVDGAVAVAVLGLAVVVGRSAPHQNGEGQGEDGQRDDAGHGSPRVAPFSVFGGGAGWLMKGTFCIQLTAILTFCQPLMPINRGKSKVFDKRRGKNVDKLSETRGFLFPLRGAC